MTNEERIKKIMLAIAALDMFCRGQMKLSYFKSWWSEHWKDAA